MRPKTCRLMLGVLLVAALVMAPAYCAEDGEDDEYADEEKALLIARKSITGSDVVLGGNLTVVIEIYNAGTRCEMQNTPEYCAAFATPAITRYYLR